MLTFTGKDGLDHGLRLSSKTVQFQGSRSLGSCGEQHCPVPTRWTGGVFASMDGVWQIVFQCRLESSKCIERSGGPWVSLISFLLLPADLLPAVPQGTFARPCYP